MRAITILFATVCFAVSAPTAQAETTSPKMAISVFTGPRTSQAQLGDAHKLLQRLQADGWFVMARVTPTLNPDACKSVHHNGETQCRDALQLHMGNVDVAAPPSVAFVFSAARNNLANLHCLGAGRYRISARQSMLTDYRLALTEGEAAETERAKIASCLLSASRELSTESNQQKDIVACAPGSLEGEWIAHDGLVIRFEGPFTDAFSERGEGKAIVVRPGQKTGEQGNVLYTKIRRMANCTFLATRHLWLDLKLHALPPHIVELKLDRAAGTLIDGYQGDTAYTRLAGPLPVKQN